MRDPSPATEFFRSPDQGHVDRLDAADSGQGRQGLLQPVGAAFRVADDGHRDNRLQAESDRLDLKISEGRAEGLADFRLEGLDVRLRVRGENPEGHGHGAQRRHLRDR